MLKNRINLTHPFRAWFLSYSPRIFQYNMCWGRLEIRRNVGIFEKIFCFWPDSRGNRQNIKYPSDLILIISYYWILGKNVNSNVPHFIPSAFKSIYWTNQLLIIVLENQSSPKLVREVSIFHFMSWVRLGGNVIGPCGWNKSSSSKCGGIQDIWETATAPRSWLL